jgi:molybdopterin/thiamine biosynthesis adenylyltransferase
VSDLLHRRLESLNRVRKEIVVIGAGGIGYHLIEPLVRFLNYTYTDYLVTLVDGDSIEDGNLSRQHEANSVGQNKAEALATIVNSRIHPRHNVVALPYFFSPTTLAENSVLRGLIKNDVTVFVCVDNNATRVYVELLISELETATMISGGNDLLKGQAQIYVRSGRKDLTPKPSDVNPEIMDLDDEFPDEVGCDEAVVSEPQLIFTNNMVACMMLSLWYSHCHTDSENKVNEVCTDVVRVSASPFVRKSLKPVLSK